MKKVLVLIAIAVFSLDSFSASFDCLKAKLPTEIAICSNENLSKLDTEVSKLYVSIKEKYPNLKKEQIAWIKETRLCAETEDINSCLEGAMIKRIGLLEALGSIEKKDPNSLLEPHIKEVQASKKNSAEVVTNNAVKDNNESNSLSIIISLLVGGFFVYILMKPRAKSKKKESLESKKYTLVTEESSVIVTEKQIDKEQGINKMNSETIKINFRSYPSGEYALFKLTDEEINALKVIHESGDDFLESDLYSDISSMGLANCLGSSYGLASELDYDSDGFDEGVNYVCTQTIRIPFDHEGIFVVFSVPTKLVLDLELDTPDGNPYDPNELTIEYTEVALNEVEDENGDIEYNLITNILYKGNPLVDSLADYISDRGGDCNLTIFRFIEDDDIEVLVMARGSELIRYELDSI